MTKPELEQFVTARGFKIDGGHQGAGKFRDIYVGTGSSYPALRALKNELEANGVAEVFITHVDNSDHPDYGKPMIEIKSFWCG